ncbi:hypothetical protein FPV67DRAFT_1456354 [Lyophyllum atratum]|nr:hypothetical protein FPV67DRAFT_1456354 [Lyophyllum atratum]
MFQQRLVFLSAGLIWILTIGESRRQDVEGRSRIRIFTYVFAGDSSEEDGSDGRRRRHSYIVGQPYRHSVVETGAWLRHGLRVRFMFCKRFSVPVPVETASDVACLALIPRLTTDYESLPIRSHVKPSRISIEETWYCFRNESTEVVELRQNLATLRSGGACGNYPCLLSVTPSSTANPNQSGTIVFMFDEKVYALMTEASCRRKDMGALLERNAQVIHPAWLLKEVTSKEMERGPCRDRWRHFGRRHAVLHSRLRYGGPGDTSSGAAACEQGGTALSRMMVNKTEDALN